MIRAMRLAITASFVVLVAGCSSGEHDQDHPSTRVPGTSQQSSASLLDNTTVDPVDAEVTRYRAEFVEVSSLLVGDDVRIAGVKVGGVEKIAIEGDQAIVTFWVPQEQKLTETTGLILRYQNLSGQRYLALVPGSKDAAIQAADSLIPFARTSAGFDLTALLNGFRPLFAVLKPADVNALAASLIKVLQGEGVTVAQLLQEITELANDLPDRDQVFHQVAVNLNPLLEELSGNGEQFQSTANRLARLTTGLEK